MLRNSLHVSRDACRCLLLPAVRRAPCYNVEQIRSTVVVERMFKPGLGKKGQFPPLKKKHTVLKVVERVHNHPTPMIQCILTAHVEGLGSKGEVVEVQRNRFRNHLYPMKMATYASPENLKELEEQRVDVVDGPKMSASGQLTLKQLENFRPRVPMSGDNPWVLNKTHIRVALRKMGVEVTDECLQIPQEAIMEPQDVTIGITINKQKTVQMTAIVYNVFKDPTENTEQEFPKVWSKVKTTKPEDTLHEE